MKIEDVAYAIAGETLSVLEEKYHYRIPDEHKRDIQRTVQSRLSAVLTSAGGPASEAPSDEAGASAEA